MKSVLHGQTCGRLVMEDGLGGLCASCVFKLLVDGASSAASLVGRSLLTIPGYEVREEIA